jgi:hypothetical protein
MDFNKLAADLAASTPGPWSVFGKTRVVRHRQEPIHDDATGTVEICECGDMSDAEIRPYNQDRWEADARLIAASRDLANLVLLIPELREALALHVAWADSEESGPNYGSLSRDTHPNGESIWRDWWEGNLSLCGRADRATRDALAKLDAALSEDTP